MLEEGGGDHAVAAAPPSSVLATAPSTSLSPRTSSVSPAIAGDGGREAAGGAGELELPVLSTDLVRAQPVSAAATITSRRPRERRTPLAAVVGISVFRDTRLGDDSSAEHALLAAVGVTRKRHHV
jgi:hypothetical protein